MVGDGQGIHAQPGGLADQLVDAADAVDEAVFGMDVQVGEHIGAGETKNRASDAGGSRPR